MIVALLALVSALDAPSLLGVSCAPSPGGATVKLLATGPLDGPIGREQAGRRVVLAIPALLPASGLPLPAPVPPVRALEFVTGPEPLARLRVVLDPGARLDTRSEGSLLTIEVVAAGETAAPASPDVADLYAMLFPPESPAEPTPAPAKTEVEGVASSEHNGWHLGPISFDPAVTLRYVDAFSSFLDTPQPVQARYFEIQPNLGLRTSTDASILGGRLSVGYEPLFRLGDDGIPILKRPSHFFTGNYERPIGSSWWASLTDQYSLGGIETQVVDPGQEYFFDLGRFRRNQLAFAVRTESASRLELRLGGSMSSETLDSGAGYFTNERRGFNVGVQYEWTPAVNLTLGYVFESVPPPAARPVVESRMHSLALGLEGDVTPLMHARLSAGYLNQSNPKAVLAANGYRGLTFAGSLRRDLASGAQLTLAGSRATQLSAFENNAFYLSDDVSLALNAPVWLSVQLDAGVSYRRNSYRLNANALNEPRRDRIFGWRLGLARPLTERAFLRLDYTRDRRSSNVPGFSTRGHALILSLGIGLGPQK